MFATLAFGSTVYAQTILRVDGQNGLTLAQGATGADWAHAFLYLQDALAQATGGSFEIWVAQGTYKPDQGNGLTPGDTR